MKQYMASALALLVILTAMSIVRNALWYDESSIWMDAIRKSPNKGRPYHELGLHYLSIGRNYESLLLLRKVLQLDPSHLRTYSNLGIALQRLNRIDEAVSVYKRAIAYNPTDPSAYYNIGVLYYLTLKNPQKALEYLLKARDLNPRDPDTHAYLSRIYWDIGDTKKAYEEMALSQYWNQ